jgi:16S rRNA (guanine966-N2)-methyltransferase
MRIIAGKAKGQRLKGATSRATRPTSDLVRGAIFSALGSLGADLSRVLDLYAGSGALGIEALSRGAAWCDFVEHSRAACAVIKQNLSLTSFAHQARVHCTTAQRALKHLTGPYTLVLADPPYADAYALAALEEAAASSLVDQGEVVLVLEHSARQAAPTHIGWWELANSRHHGDTAISIYR